MKKSLQFILLVIVICLLALMATNPSIEDHRQAVMKELEKKMSQESNPDNKWEQVGQSIGMALGQGIVEKAVSRDNYLIFSITKIKLNETQKTIGYGILGNVEINDKLEEVTFPEKVDLIAFVAGFLGLFTFIPQIVKSLREKRTRDLSLAMIVIALISQLMWFCFGYLRSDMIVAKSNLFMIAISLLLISIKVKYNKS